MQTRRRGTVNTKSEIEIKVEPSEKVPRKNVRETVAIEYENEGKRAMLKNDTASSNWMPPNWHQVLCNIREMRKERNAVVDSQGAECCFDKEDSVDEKEKRFQILISLMLSSQTKDEVTHATMMCLREGGLNVKNILDMSHDDLSSVIKKVGFWRRKTEYIKKVAEILHKDFDDDIPDTVEGLIKLPGVGQKMAHLAMKIAWHQNTGKMLH